MWTKRLNYILVTLVPTLKIGLIEIVGLIGQNG